MAAHTPLALTEAHTHTHAHRDTPRGCHKGALLLLCHECHMYVLCTESGGPYVLQQHTERNRNIYIVVSVRLAAVCFVCLWLEV